MLATEKKNGIIFYITKSLLIVSIALSLFLSGILCFRVIVDPNFKIDLNHIYLIGILFVAGILGDQLSIILEKIIRDKIEKHITPEIIIGTDAFKNTLEQVLGNRVDPFLAKINLELGVNKNESVEDNEVLPKEDAKYDTVIVPATWSIEGNKKYKFYFCQKDRSFSNAIYIALYGSKMIRFVGKAKILSQSELEEKLKNPGFREWLTKEMGITPDVAYGDFYDLSVDSKELAIVHDEPGALTRKQIYSNYQSLVKEDAKTTNDIFR